MRRGPAKCRLQEGRVDVQQLRGDPEFHAQQWQVALYLSDE
jgi:hypothetical protein